MKKVISFILVLTIVLSSMSVFAMEERVLIRYDGGTMNLRQYADVYSTILEGPGLYEGVLFADEADGGVDLRGPFAETKLSCHIKYLPDINKWEHTEYWWARVGVKGYGFNTTTSSSNAAWVAMKKYVGVQNTAGHANGEPCSHMTNVEQWWATEHNTGTNEYWGDHTTLENWVRMRLATYGVDTTPAYNTTTSCYKSGNGFWYYAARNQNGKYYYGLKTVKKIDKYNSSGTWIGTIPEGTYLYWGTESATRARFHNTRKDLIRVYATGGEDTFTAGTFYVKELQDPWGLLDNGHWRNHSFK